MYFILYLTDILTVTDFLHHPQTQPNFKMLINFLKLLVIILSLGGNLSYFNLNLTDNFSMTNFLHYPPTFKSTKCLTSNMFSEAPRDQIKLWSSLCESTWTDMALLYSYILMLFDELRCYNSVTYELSPLKCRGKWSGYRGYHFSNI